MTRPGTAAATKGRPAVKPPTDREIVQTIAAHVATPRERSEAARERRYQAERDLLVAVLSRIWPSHITQAARGTLVWTEIVCIHSPVGQLAWGLAVDRAHLFAHLEHSACDWDGHRASQRDARLRQLLALETLAPAPARTPTAAPRRRSKRSTR